MATVGAVTTATQQTTGNSSVTGSLANNFNTFLQLLTTQLKNQNPLDPLDTNQFTQQLVQFASVEQQMSMNSQLSTLISLQQTSQSTAALGFVGRTVTVNGATSQLADGQAQWTFTLPKAAKVTVTLKNDKGGTVMTQTQDMPAGTQSFAWNGRNSDGVAQPNGPYTVTVTAADSSGQSVAVSTQVKGVVSSVDVSQNPPVLTIGGAKYPINQITQVNQ